MTKKRLLLIAAVPLAIAVILGVLVMLTTRSTVTKANFERIQEGMTRAEVEEVFGEKGEQELPGIVAAYVWYADDGSWTAIDFVDGCVVRKSWHDSADGFLRPARELTFFQKLRLWLHLR